jgi:hypothetical protein
MRAKVAVQALAHAAVAVDHVTQWASYLKAHCTTKATAGGDVIFICHPQTPYLTGDYSDMTHP